MANLAATYRNQGRWKEAEDLEAQVVDEFEGVSSLRRRLIQLDVDPSDPSQVERVAINYMRSK